MDHMMVDITHGTSVIVQTGKQKLLYIFKQIRIYCKKLVIIVLEGFRKQMGGGTVALLRLQ